MFGTYLGYKPLQYDHESKDFVIWSNFKCTVVIHRHTKMILWLITFVRMKEEWRKSSISCCVAARHYRQYRHWWMIRLTAACLCDIQRCCNLKVSWTLLYSVRLYNTLQFISHQIWFQRKYNGMLFVICKKLLILLST